MPELDFERITLNAIPEGDMPVFHASQFETMRPFIADLKWGSEVFAPGEGCWCTLSIRKTDDTLVIIDDIDIDTNTVSCVLTQQSVACVGDNFCQLKVWSTSEDDEDGCIACLNFILHVQPDPEAGGITSDSEINNLTKQIKKITQQVIGDDYYNKVQTDALLDLKADKATTYTKSEVDTALNLKADKSTTYTKSQVDSALALKADASNVYTKAETYNKTETDNLLDAKANSADLATVATTGDYDDLINKPTIPAAQVQSDYAQADNTQVDYIKNKPDIEGMIADALLEIMPFDTESGPIASFVTELAAPLVNVSCEVVATGGNGTPDNPIPINGYTEANITRCGVNLFDKTAFADDYSSTYEIDTDGSIKQIGTPNVNDILWTNITKKSGSFTLTFKVKYSVSGSVGVRPKIIYTDGTSETVYPTNTQVYTDYVKTTNASKTVDKIITDYGSAAIMTNFYFQVENASQASDLTDYNGNTYTIAFGQTVYGGVLDVTRGKLTVTHIRGDLGDYAWTYDSTNQRFATGTISPLAKAMPSGSPVDYMCEIYESKPYGVNSSYSGEDNIFYIHQNGYLRIIDTSFNGDTDAFTTAVTGKYIAYPLATPFDIDLTPVQISALVGVNNVYSDTNGDTTVQFKDSIQHYIDTRS